MDTPKARIPLPIGRSSFDNMIEGSYYYVDKTLFIRDLLDNGAQVTLCTRPRRFGKTLNQTMLKCFFENTAPFGGKDTRALFSGLKIESAGDKYLEHQGKYPVIFLSFKEAKRASFEEAYTQLKNNVIKEFERHDYVVEKITSQNDREVFEKIVNGNGNLYDYSTSLAFLSKCLADYHGKRTIVLIDDCDVPLENSWKCGYYEKMVDCVHSLLG
ncbi:MAG: AAA family ATPase, partial [Bacteroidales bacterium]|nr:AAA family ATPase [Bacteroidales bacterium]